MSIFASTVWVLISLYYPDCQKPVRNCESQASVTIMPSKDSCRLLALKLELDHNVHAQCEEIEK